MTIPAVDQMIGQEILKSGTLPPAMILANVLGAAHTGPGLLVFSQTRQCLFSNSQATRLLRDLRQLEPRRRLCGELPHAVLRCCRDLEDALERHPNPKSWGRVQLVRVLGGEGNMVLTRFQAIPSSQEPARISLIVGLLEPLSRPTPDPGPSAAPDFQFSGREQACVTHLIQGMTDKEIARQMGISEYTVKDHLKHIRQKTGAINRAGIIARVLGRSQSHRNGAHAARTFHPSEAGMQ